MVFLGKGFVIRTHKEHWENDCVVAVFYDLEDAFEYIRSHLIDYSCDCFSISLEEFKK